MLTFDFSAFSANARRIPWLQLQRGLCLKGVLTQTLRFEPWFASEEVDLCTANVAGLTI